MARFILSTMFTGGDLIPFVRMGSALRQRGHDVVLVTHAASEKKARAAGFEFEPIDDLGDLESAMRDAEHLSDPRHAAAYFRAHVLPRAGRECEAIGRHRSDDAVIVGRSNTSLGARFASEIHQLPFVSTYLSPAFAAGAGTTKYVLESFASDLNRMRASLGLGPVSDWDSWLRCGRGVGLWPAWFKDDGGNWPANLALTGFLLGAKTGSLPADVGDTLDGERPVLVTGGSGSYMTREYFVAAIHGAELFGRRILLVAPDRSLLPAELPPSTLVLDFVEFADLFPRVAAVVHHGGIATCGEALAAGVPQLVMGAWFDRPDNAAHLQRLGVGEYLAPARATPETVSASLARLVSSDGVRRRCAELAERIDGESYREALVASLVQSVGSNDVVRVREPAPVSMPARTEPRHAQVAKVRALSPAKRTLIALTLRHEQRAEPHAISAAPRDRDIAVTPLQEGILHWMSVRPPSATMNLTFSARLEGELDVAALERAAAEIVRRHESLRTRFVRGEHGYIQRIDPPPLCPLLQIDLRELGPDVARAEADRILTEDSHHEFRVADEPSARFTLVRETASAGVCIITTHSLACGPLDVARLWSEIAELYDDILAGTKAEPKEPVQYVDYSEWLRAWFAGDGASVVERCRNRLAGARAVDLPVDRPRRSPHSLEGETVRFDLPRDLVEPFDAVCQERRLSPAMVITAAVSALIADRSGQSDVVVGILTDTRNVRPELSTTIGRFLNIVPCRLQIPREATGVELLTLARTSLTEAYADRIVPGEMCLDHPSALDSPLLRVLINVVTDLPTSPRGLKGLTFTESWFQPEDCKSEIVLSASRTMTGSSLGWEFFLRAATSSYDRTTVQRLADDLVERLRALVTDPDRSLRG